MPSGVCGVASLQTGCWTAWLRAALFRLKECASGVSESANDSNATNHSGDDTVFEEARAART